MFISDRRIRRFPSVSFGVSRSVYCTESLLNYSAEDGARLICEVIKQTNELGKLPAGTPQTGEASYTGIRKFITSCSIVTLNGPTGAPLISRPSTPTIACSTSLNSISRVLKG